jgi:hypothetical protein
VVLWKSFMCHSNGRASCCADSSVLRGQARTWTVASFLEASRSHVLFETGIWPVLAYREKYSIFQNME